MGPVPRSVLTKFFHVFEMLLAEVQQRKRDKRSAVNGQGHQKTPAMVYALLKQAQQVDWETDIVDGDEQDIMRVASKPEVLPQGGFTDVGLHTGGKPRNTPWMLVQAVFQVRKATIETIKMSIHHDVCRTYKLSIHTWQGSLA